MDQKKTGEFIATLRKEKGLTQRQLAEEQKQWREFSLSVNKVLGVSGYRFA